MSESVNYFEYSVEAKPEGKLKTRRVLFILGYILFALVFMTIVFITKLIPLGAFVILFTAIIVYYTWKYVQVEYEYVIAQGEMTFSVIYGGKARKDFLNIKIKDMTLIAPYNEQYGKKADSVQKKYYAASTMKSPDLYFALFPDKGGQHCVVFFEATEKMLKLSKFYNSSATVVSDSLRY